MINKSNWVNLGAKQCANSMATQKPKILFPKNSLLQKEWDLIEKHNDLLKINYNIIQNAYINSKVFLGLKVIQNQPLLFLGYSNSYEMIGNKLIKLDVMIKISNNVQLHERYDISDDNEYKNIIRSFAVDSNTKNIFNSNWISNDFKDTTVLRTKNIPYALFFSNPMENAEFENVDSQLLEDYSKHISLLLTDSKVSKGLIHLNTPQMQGTSENINKLKQCLEDEKAVVYENTNIFSLLQQGGLTIQQGSSNYQSLLDKLKFYESKIKQFAFMKKESSDLGTKNLQSSETELLNSDADDYIELKANFLELQWEFFIRNVFFDYLKSIKGITTDYKNAIIEVECMGSTKYLQNIKNAYIQNQNGVLTNPNEIFNDKGKKYGKEENVPDTAKPQTINNN